MKSIWTRLPNYSPVIAGRLKCAVRRSLVVWSVWFSVVGGTALYLLTEILKGKGDEATVGMLLTLLVFSLLPAYGSLKSKLFEESNLMSYFSAEVAGCGLCSGFALLRNSGKIDQYATANNLRPLGLMISDDDLFDRKKITWGNPGDTLKLVQGLLSVDEAYAIECRQDLEELKLRLEYAVEHGIQFCFIIRTIHATNALEWEQRKGYC